MMTTKKEATADVLDRPADASRPKFVVPLGRGSRGKSVFARWATERARRAGRQLVLADADRTNQTLSAFFRAEVVRPESAADQDMREWLDRLIEGCVERRESVLLDLGGGDLLLKRLAAELDLVAFLVAEGIEPVAVHMIGPDEDDQAYLASVEAFGPDRRALFAPARTLVVANEGVVPFGRSAATAFAGLLTSERLRSVIDRGAEIVVMPPLCCMPAVENHRMTFAEAVGSTKLGLLDRQRVATWLSDMDRVFADVQEWLP